MTIVDVAGITPEQVAAMSDEQLHNFRVELALVRGREANAREEADSPVGRRILERKKVELQNLREEYGKIAVGGKSDNSVVRYLIWKQAKEEYLAEDIDIMESSENNSEVVDTVMAMCDDVVAERELRAHSSR